MMITRNFPIDAKIDLPDQCVVCGKSSENNIVFNQDYFSILAQSLAIASRRKMEIPYCNKHLNSFVKKFKYLSYSQATIFILGFLLLLLPVITSNPNAPTFLKLNMRLGHNSAFIFYALGVSFIVLSSVTFFIKPFIYDVKIKISNDVVSVSAKSEEFIKNIYTNVVRNEDHLDEKFLEETLELKDGLGILNIEGKEDESILYLNNEPIAMVFYNCDGTTMRYYAGTEFEKNIIASNVEYEKIVNKGEVDFNQPLAQQFNFILQLLNNSTYKLELSSASTGFHIYNAVEKHDKGRFYEDYGGTYCYIQTQAQINNAKVKEYKQDIKKGIRPIVVLLQIKNSETPFILDGHHKLLAYEELGVGPQILMITKLLNSDPNYESGFKILQQLGVNDKKAFEKYGGGF